jgi:hypothetical protein
MTGWIRGGDGGVLAREPQVDSKIVTALQPVTDGCQQADRQEKASACDLVCERDAVRHFAAVAMPRQGSTVTSRREGHPANLSVKKQVS